MKEIFFSPEFINQEKKRIEEEGDLTDTQALQKLIEVYGSKSVVNYLNWYAERITNSVRESSESSS